MTIDISKFAENLVNNNGVWSPSQDQDKISYPEDGNSVCYQIEDSSFWFNHRNKCIESCLKIFHDKGSIFFDIGGGNGFVAKGLQARGYNVCLVEPGLEGIKNAKLRGVRNLIHATLESGSFKESNLTSVGAFDVIEHIEDDARFVSNLNSYLKPGGKLFLTVPAANWLWSVNDEIAGHYRRYTIGSLSALLEDNGYKLDYISYMFKPLVYPLFFMRTIPSKLGLINLENARAKTLKHHTQKARNSQSSIDKMLRKEYQKIATQQMIKSGTSVIAVATKQL